MAGRDEIAWLMAPPGAYCGRVRIALLLVGFAGVGFGAALVGVAIWLGERYDAEDIVWPGQLTILAFALVFVVGGVLSLRAGFTWGEPD